MWKSAVADKCICEYVECSTVVWTPDNTGTAPQNEYDILKQIFADLAIVALNPVYFPQRLVLFLPTMWLPPSFQNCSEWQFQEFGFDTRLFSVWHKS